MKGSTAAVCELDRATQEVKVNRITNFGSFHYFSYEEEGLRLSKAYGVGAGRLVPWCALTVEKQSPTLIKDVVNYEFFSTMSRKIKSTNRDPEVQNENGLFQCQEPGCSRELSTAEGLEDHVHFGQHDKTSCATSESLYDKLRRDWAAKCSSMTLETEMAASTVDGASVHQARSESCHMGWALQKPRGGGSRFSENVKAYLSTRFDIGEDTGRKADRAQVADDIRKARDADGKRRFQRSEWLSKSQVQGFFSRLPSSKRRKGVREVDD